MLMFNEWTGEYIDVRPDDFGEWIIHDYWCPVCKQWQVFQFENWGMCDWCAMAKAFAPKVGAGETARSEAERPR